MKAVRAVTGAVVLSFVSGCTMSSCNSLTERFFPRKAVPPIVLGTLPDGNLVAAKSVGQSIATEKDPARLAGQVAAFLQRIDVPVINSDWSGFLAKGTFTRPAHQVFTWEPLLYGMAKGTVEGGSFPMTLVIRAFDTKDSIKISKDADFSEFFRIAGEQAESQKLQGPDAMLIVAIAEALRARKETHNDPRMDPVSTMLLGIWVSLGAAVRSSTPSTAKTPGSGAIPALPSGIPGFPGGKLPPWINVRGLKNEMTPEAAGCGVLGLAATEVEWGTKINTYLKDASKLFGIVPNLPGPAKAALDSLTDLMELPIVELIETISAGLNGMAIAAFVDTNGKADPKETKYGGKTVEFKVHVESHNPLDKTTMDRLSCFAKLNPVIGAKLGDFDKVPPRGAVPDIPVVWHNYSQLDPKHGTFTVDIPSSSTDWGVVQYIKSLGEKFGVNITNDGGDAKATFKPRPADSNAHGYKRFEHKIVYAAIFPFPIDAIPPGKIGAGAVRAASNLLFHREEPLAFELETPIPRNWILHINERHGLTGSNVAGGWELLVQGSVPITLDANMQFDGKGTGVFTYMLKTGSFGGEFKCDAPARPMPIDLKAHGKVLDLNTMETDFTIDIRGEGAVNSAIKCTGPMNIKINVPFKAPISGKNVTDGTPLKQFKAPLEDGTTKHFVYDTQNGSATDSVTADVRFEAINEN